MRFSILLSLGLVTCASAQPPPTVAFNGFGAVALSPDGKWVAASGAPGTTVRLWETATGKDVAALPGHDSEVSMVVFSRDGKRLFAATTTEVRTWELPSGKPLLRIPAGPGWRTNQMTLSGDGRWFISEPDLEPKVTPDGKFVVASIRLWHVETARELRRFEIVRSTGQLLGQYADFFARGKGSDAILGTALSRDGKSVAAGTERGEVHLWDVATGKKLRTFGRSNDIAALPVGFSKDGKRLVTSVYTHADLQKTAPPATVRLWDVATGEARQTIQGLVFDWSLSGDGQWLITGRDEKTVRIWDVETGKEVRAFGGHDKPVTDCSISNDRKSLATYDQSGTVRLWDVTTGRELRALQVHPRPDHVRFSQDAKWLAAWSASRLALWDLEKGKEIRSMTRKVDE
jgi:WD40 repeat protein